MSTKTRITTAALLIAGLLAALPAAAKSELIFQLEDPRGDDHGDGRLVYPLRTEFAKGDLDLVKFSAWRVNGATRFEAEFAEPIRAPGREAVDDLGTQLDSVARYGFYTFNIDVYIDLDGEAGSGAIGTMPGRMAEVENAWDRAIILTPKPHEARGALERLMVKELSAELRRVDDTEQSWSLDSVKSSVPAGLADRVYFPTRVRVRNRTISFLVPDAFLKGPASADWTYTVAVSGSSLVQSLDLAASVGLADSTRDALMILPISPGVWKDRFGGGREGQELQPPLVDILVPAGVRQERVLSDFSTAEGRPARLPGVVPARGNDEQTAEREPTKPAEAEGVL